MNCFALSRNAIIFIAGWGGTREVIHAATGHCGLVRARVPGGQWTLVGPYADREACSGVVQWLETQGIETESCTMASTDVDAVLIQIGERP